MAISCLPKNKNGGNYAQVKVPIAEFKSLSKRGYEGYEHMRNSCADYLGISVNHYSIGGAWGPKRVLYTHNADKVVKPAPCCTSCESPLTLYVMAGLIQECGEDQLAIVGECSCGNSYIIRTFENGD